MPARLGTFTRRLPRWSLGAVVALTLWAPAPALVAHEVGRPSTTATPARPAKSAVQLEGTLEILHEDRDDGSSRYHHTLISPDGARLALDGVAPGLDLLSGDHVRVHGHHTAAAFQLQPVATAPGLEVLAAAPLANTFGVQKTLVILVNFANTPTQPYSVAQATTGYAAVDAWFREASYQQTSLAIDVAGWFTLSLTTATCNTTLIQSQARQAAAAAGVNLAAYVRQVYAFPFNPACLFAGMGSIGGTPSSVWINGNTSTGILAHEFGHTLGLYHSHALNCHPSVVTPPCAIVEYGDATDAMGGGTGHYNAFQKQRLGWLDFHLSPPITPVATSGPYAIAAYELPGTAPKALKIPRGTTGQFFFVELRRPLGWDATLYRTGVFIHLASDALPNSSTLLDMTPATSPLSDDAFLDVGKSFTNPVSGVTITTVAVSGTGATIQVGLAAPAACTPSAPSITASPIQSPAVEPGTAVTYTVVVTNTDAAGCPASTFVLQATPPTTSWLKAWGAPSLPLTPGATASAILRMTSPVVPAGAYPIAIAAISLTDATAAASTTVSYTVASSTPIVTDAVAFTDTFDRPDALQLDNGWSVMTGSLIVQAGEGRNQPDTTFSLGMQLGLTGPAQLAQGTFASTNNNSAPRFGVVVRYQNPQNYYLCYRQVGGSSVLRIAKVQNGVETVLKSVGIGNPTVQAFFTLSCQASGTTLTLGVDGVTKASTTNASFITGSTGYTISTLKGTSHRTATFTTSAQ